MSKRLRDDTQGLLRIYKLNAPTYHGRAAKRIRDVPLPISPRAVQDAPHLVSLTQDGNHLACGTPKCGYFFAWDISRVRMMDPILISSGSLKVTHGPAQKSSPTRCYFRIRSTSSCSTFPHLHHRGRVGWDIHRTYNTAATANAPPSVVHPTSRPPRDPLRTRSTRQCRGVPDKIWDDMDHAGSPPRGRQHLTTFAPLHSKERLQNQQTPEGAGGLPSRPKGIGSSG